MSAKPKEFPRPTLVARVALVCALLLCGCARQPDTPASDEQQIIWGDREQPSLNTKPTTSPNASEQISPTPTTDQNTLDFGALNRGDSAAPPPTPERGLLDFDPQEFSTRMIEQYAFFVPQGTPPATPSLEMDEDEEDDKNYLTRFQDVVDRMKQINVPLPTHSGDYTTEFGIQIAGCENDPNQSTELAKEVGFSWVKQQIRWGDIASPDGEVIDWRCPDAVAAAAYARGLKLLFSITTSPLRLRRSSLGQTLGPPMDLKDWANFLDRLVERYRGRLHAIEVWNEPNIQAEWSEGPNAWVYRRLLGAAYVRVKRRAPEIMIISGGMAAPLEGYHQPRYIGDVEFVAEIAENGALLWTDCIGYHANGPIGSGDAVAILQRYRNSLLEPWAVQGVRPPLCLTEFSYSLPLHGKTPKDFSWAIGHTEEEQADRFAEWITALASSRIVRLAIVFNLDYNFGDVNPNNIAALSRPDLKGLALQRIKATLSSIHSP